MNEIIENFIDIFDEKRCSLLHFPIIFGDVRDVLKLLIFINFVLISSGNTKFSMASCMYLKDLENTFFRDLPVLNQDIEFRNLNHHLNMH